MPRTAIVYSTTGRMAGMALCRECLIGVANRADPRAWAEQHNRARHEGRLLVTVVCSEVY